MKISKMIEVLQARMAKHGDIEVEGTYDHLTAPIEPNCVYLSKDTPHALLIDAQHSGLKFMMASDEYEGDDEK